MRVYITSHDPIVERIHSPAETEYLYGQEFLDEQGTDIPDELWNRYITNYEEFWKVQAEIDRLLKSRGKS